ncbi:MAG: ABC transporter permease [Sandaracinaceae bacterium]
MLEFLFVSIPVAGVLLSLLAFGGALAGHPFAARVGWRYLRSRKRRTVSVITFIAVTGVALGVAALLAVMSITSGFQREFRTKVLGVNAHVLVLKYGLDFTEYGRVVEQAMEMPEVAGAAPFIIQDMMLTRGDQIAGVLVKGVDPGRMPDVLDLPGQMTQGSLRGLRAPGAAPALRPGDLLRDMDPSEVTSLDVYLRSLADGGGEGGADRPPEPGGAGGEGADDRPPDGDASDGAAPPGAGGPALPSDDLEDALFDDDLAAGDAGFLAPDALPEVVVPTPEEAEAALAEGPDGLPEDAYEDQLFDEELLLFEDDGAQDDEVPGIVLGTTLAANLGLGVGDRVRITSPLAGLDTAFLGGAGGSAPRSRQFRVVGIFSAGFQEYDSRLVYVDLYEAQHFFDQGDSVTGVEIRLHDLDQSALIARRLERVLGAGPYHTLDWRELNRNLFTALEIQKVYLSLVITVIIFVAAFNVVATLIMIVLEKKREIAILKAMGASSVSVLLIFMVQGVLIGLLGTLIGLLMGGGVCLYLERFAFPLDPHVYLIDHLPVRTSGVEFLLTVSFAVLICMFATVIPSWWAARLLPAEGVRYE